MTPQTLKKTTTNISLTENEIPANTKAVYRFLNSDGEILYVGKATHFNERMKSHFHLSPECYAQIAGIEILVLEKKDKEHDIEQVQIAFLKPKYNKAEVSKRYSLSQYQTIRTDWQAVSFTTPHFEECKRLFAELIEFKKSKKD